MLLVPIAFLIVGAVAVMCILTRNLASLDRETIAAWDALQQARCNWIDSLARVADAARAHGTVNTKITCAVQEAASEARGALLPDEAATTDDALAEAYRVLTAAVDEQSLDTNDSSLSKLINRATVQEDRLATCQGVYNNRATMYGNAGRTFPTLLVAKRMGFNPHVRYQPHAIGSFAVAAPDGSTALAEASPRIMNAYMLWAIGLSDTVLEEAPRAASTDAHTR